VYKNKCRLLIRPLLPRIEHLMLVHRWPWSSEKDTRFTVQPSLLLLYVFSTFAALFSNELTSQLKQLPGFVMLASSPCTDLTILGHNAVGEQEAQPVPRAITSTTLEDTPMPNKLDFEILILRPEAKQKICKTQNDVFHIPRIPIRGIQKQMSSASKATASKNRTSYVGT
nr:hypothetical protein [Tanacetum cinerariifolium]